MHTNFEVRRADDGTLWRWAVATSDVPGAGGAWPVEQVTLANTLTHKAGVLAEYAATLQRADELKAKLAAAEQMEQEINAFYAAQPAA